MPALPAVSRVVRVDHIHSFGGNADVRCREFFQYTGALSQADAQTWVDAIANAWKNNTMTHLATTLTLTSTVLTDLTSSSSAQAVSSVTGIGTNGSAIGSASLAIIVKKKLARRYRGGHPKVYLPGIPAGNLLTPETWSAATLTAVAADFAAYISAALLAVPVAAAPAFEVNVSYFVGFHNITLPSGRETSRPTARVTPLVDTVVSHQINPKPAEQRRRNQQST